MSSVDPAKLTPEIADYLKKSSNSQSVFTEQQINAVQEGGDNGLASSMIEQNQTAIDASGFNAKQAEVLNASQFARAPTDRTEPIIQGPTKAQDTYSLRQTPTALMSGVPRMKFEYLAAFRFYGSDNNFEEIFSDAEINSLDQQIQVNQNLIGTGPAPGMISNRASNLKAQRQDVIESIKRSLVFNIRQVDGPKVNFQYDTLNQYNRKRNVYRRVDYDPVSIRFHDTMSNTALKFFRYLYELNLRDGRNRSPSYTENKTRQGNKGVYQTNPLSLDDAFTREHNFGLESSITPSTYPIKSLDLFIVHGTRYNLIRFVHPKIIAMDHDVLSYESSQPIEIGMQFAYETVLYETLNHSMGDAKDVAVDFEQIFENSLKMPETLYTETAPVEGTDGAGTSSYDWTKMTTSIPDEQTARTVGTGSNIMTASSFANDVGGSDATYGGSSEFNLGSISSTPFSDAINQVSKEVYGAAKSAVSSFGAGGTSGGNQGANANNESFFSGLGDMFKGASAGTGKNNPDSKNYQAPKGGTVKDSKGNVIKDSNGNAVRQGTRFSTNY